MNRENIYSLIDKERKRQDDKWGAIPRNLHVMIWMTVLGEEVGEIARAILKRDWDNMKEEIVQVAAVCVAWLEDSENFDDVNWKAG